MSRSKAETFADAFAHAMDPMAAEPVRCEDCMGTNVELELEREWVRCLDCGTRTTMLVSVQQRERRAFRMTPRPFSMPARGL